MLSRTITMNGCAAIDNTSALSFLRLLARVLWVCSSILTLGLSSGAAAQTSPIGIPALLFPGLLLSAANAGAVEIPSSKPGLWEVRVQSRSNSKIGAASAQTFTMQSCVGMHAADEKKSREMMQEIARKSCSKNELRREGGKWIQSSVCKIVNSTMSGRMTLEFNGESTYHGEANMSYDPPLGGDSRKQMVIDGKWLGPCK